MNVNERIARALGVDIPPHRDVAMVAVGWKHILSTGPTFMLTNGREVPMPNGAELRKPEGTDDWNARYALHVAEVLGDEIKAEVDAYRLPAEPYDCDLNLMIEAERFIADRGLQTAYINALDDLRRQLHIPWNPETGLAWWYLTAPACMRAQAAANVLEGK